MSTSQLSAVLVNALADEHFCHRLLAEPSKALTRFDLSPAERDALASIRASSIEEFAAGMVNWLSGGQPAPRHSGMAPVYGPRR
jgi:hypothetical protein